MPVKLKWPWLGIAIPCFLISFIGYGAHYFVLSNFASKKKQFWFQCCLTMIWLSYYLAIYKSPGKSSKSYYPQKHEWKRFCKKCQMFKGPRTHHCKSCDQCVLMMDHHCPWTMNCVGLENFPHFMRFLFWVIITSSFLMYLLLGRISYIYKNRNLPQYMFSIWELVFLALLTPLDAFVLLTIFILLCRCLYNQVFSGQTQIEGWEMERLEAMFHSKKLLPRLINVAREVYPGAQILEEKEEVTKLLNSRHIAFDDVVNFPFDIDPWTNAKNLLGDPLLWLWPFGKPRENGIRFLRNDASEHILDSNIGDILLSLPWPPDGGRTVSRFKCSTTDIESSFEAGEQLIRKRPAECDLQSRSEWRNEWGENLEGFGVDTNADLEEASGESN